MTIERMGKAEPTEFGTDFNDLCQELDKIKTSAETVLSHTIQMLEPNPALRFESAVYRKMGRQERNVTNAFVSLGFQMMESGKSFGPETQYGGYLMRSGEVESKIGRSMDKFRDRVKDEFVIPLRTFLNVDIKNALAEKKLANLHRLDLDGAKSKQRQAKGEHLGAAEEELRKAQAVFDAQVEKTKSVINKICRSHVNHLGHLRVLISAQKDLYKECLAHLEEVDASEDMSGLASTDTRSSLEKVDLEEFQFRGLTLNRRNSRRARLLYDFDASQDDEVSVTADAFVTAFAIPGNDSYYVVIVGDDKTGKVPASHLEVF